MASDFRRNNSGIWFYNWRLLTGTALVGCSTGRIDGFFNIFGVMFGIFVFGEIYPLLSTFHTSGFMGRVTIDEWLSLSLGFVAFLVILMALGMFWGGEWLEKKFGGKEIAK